MHVVFFFALGLAQMMERLGPQVHRVKMHHRPGSLINLWIMGRRCVPMTIGRIYLEILKCFDLRERIASEPGSHGGSRLLTETQAADTLKCFKKMTVLGTRRNQTAHLLEKSPAAA